MAAKTKFAHRWRRWTQIFRINLLIGEAGNNGVENSREEGKAGRKTRIFYVLLHSFLNHKVAKEHKAVATDAQIYTIRVFVAILLRKADSRKENRTFLPFFPPSRQKLLYSLFFFQLLCSLWFQLFRYSCLHCKTSKKTCCSQIAQMDTGFCL